MLLLGKHKVYSHCVNTKLYFYFDLIIINSHPLLHISLAQGAPRTLSSSYFDLKFCSKDWKPY